LAGGANEEAAPRARDCHPATRLDSLLAVEPRRRARAPRPSRTGLALTKAQDPTRLPRIRFGLDHGPTCFGRPITEGPAPAFRPLLARSTLLRPTMTMDPVPGHWPSPSLDSAPRSASQPTLGRSAKMPRIRFYNRRFAPRAPMSKHHLWRLPAERRGKPTDVRHRDRLLERGRSWRRGSSDDAGPPCGHPASSGSALDGAMPASGRPAATLGLLGARWGEAPQLCRLAAASPDRNPLTPLVGGRA
jgi:hypothetical protein